MALDHCLATAVEGGEITKAEADRLNRDFERFRNARKADAPGLAEAQAKKDLVDLLQAETAHRRLKAKLALKSIRELDADLRSHRNSTGKADIAEAALDKLEHFGTSKFTSVEGTRKSILGMAHAKMEVVLHHFRRGALGGDKARWNAADLRNVVREAFGEDTGDAAAKGLAKAWGDTAEWLRQRFNAAGGAIGKLENWGLPQHHDPKALRAATLPVWKEFIRGRLDLTRMKHPLTGKPVTAPELDGILDEVWKTVATDGWAKKEPLRQAQGRGALANQRAEHRFLVFRDAASWLEYQEAFGGGDPFSAMMGHVNMMAKDIAAMEVLGPNPSGTVEWMKQAVRKEAEKRAAGQKSLFNGTAKNALDRANATEARLDAVWGSLRGSLETPVNSRWAAGLAAARNLVTASVLGQAALSSISDVGTTMIARALAGLPVGNAIPDIVRSFSSATKRQAVAAGLILDDAVHVFHAQARYVGTLSGPEWAQYIADRVLTYSGLMPWTQAARHAFGLAFMHETANLAGKSFDQLPDAFRSTFERYGITARQWEQLSKVPLHDMGSGSMLLRPTEISDRVDPKLAERYLGMIQSETEYAVPSGSHRSRTAFLNENRPGTIAGELQRTAFQFKAFGSVFVFLHGQRMARMLTNGDTRAAGAAYAGALLLTSAVFGAAALQLKSLVAGRDPRDISDPAFWGAAMLQGGGLGIYGDFLFANVNRYGGGFSQTLGGPLMQRASDFWNLTAGNVIQLAGGEKTNFGRELVKFAKGNIPGGNIWYLRLAFEREVLDQAQFLADPEANKAFKRQQKFFAKQFRQDYFWAPGSTAPQRGPDLGAMFGR